MTKDKLDGIEKTLEKQSKKVPQLSKGTQKGFAQALPWLSGAFGVLALVWAKDFWDAVRALDKVNDAVGALGEYINVAVGISEFDLWMGVILYVGIGALVGYAFYKGLLSMSRTGWSFMFYAFLLATITGLLFLFILSDVDSGRGFWTLAVGLAGLYLSFQVKSQFNK